MSTKKSRFNKGRANGPSSRNKVQQFVTKKQMNGGRFTPPTNPPDVTYIPWNSVTLVISHTGQLSLKVNNIKTYIRKQLDPTGRGFNPADSGDSRFVIQYRILKVQSWNLTGRVIALSIDDFIDSSADSGGRDQLCGLVDTGTSTHTPAVGYQLPSAHSHHVLRTDDKQANEYIIDVSAPGSDQCITYISMLYRFDGPAKHPTVLSPIVEVQKTLDRLSNRIMKYKEPSKMELVLNGVKYVAEAVAVLSGVDLPSTSSDALNKDAVFDDEAKLISEFANKVCISSQSEDGSVSRKVESDSDEYSVVMSEKID